MRNGNVSNKMKQMDKPWIEQMQDAGPLIFGLRVILGLFCFWIAYQIMF